MPYHLSPEDGTPRICRAKDGNCPFGPADEHHRTQADARAAYEVTMAAATAAPTVDSVVVKHGAALYALKNGVAEASRNQGDYPDYERNIKRLVSHASYLLSEYYAKLDSYEKRRSFAGMISDDLRSASFAAEGLKPRWLAPRLMAMSEDIRKETAPERLY